MLQHLDRPNQVMIHQLVAPHSAALPRFGRGNSGQDAWFSGAIQHPVYLGHFCQVRLVADIALDDLHSQLSQGLQVSPATFP